MVHRHHHHESTIPGEIPVPHGPPDSDSEHVSDEPIAYATADERRIFSHVTRPDDSYTEDGVYWADLPLAQRYRFVSKVDNEAAKEEAKTAWSMFKEDPLSPFSWYFRHAVIPGAGLGLEGYVLFSIGNLEPLFKAVWPDCWGKEPTTCSHNWIASVTYLEIIGIMVGQAVVGVMGDWVGRRWGLIQDAAIMFIGLLMLTASWGLTLQGWVICYAWSLFFYGFGVGGEYPITATSSLEGVSSGGRISTREDRLHRGRRVTTAFLMQGWGQFVNQVILIVLLAIFNNGKSSPPYSKSAAQYTFRLSFAFPAIGTLWLLYYRTYRMRSAGKQLAEAKKRSNVTGYDVNALRHCFTNFGGRLFATAGTWFCNDVFFYGNKLFQGQFIKVISPDSKSIFTTWTWNLVNITVSLAGYYLASLLIDNKMYGRKMMQQVGFFMCFLMFIIPAFKFDYYTSPAGIHSFQAMYFISSFFNQFGPNSVTFLVAGEVFPTPIRATAHGFSACIGKSGALLASVLYNYIDDQTKFYVVPWFGLAGMLLTWIFLPDTTGLDLKEQERRWYYIRDGKESEYHGVAVNPTHLSLWERFRGLGKSYDPEADWRAKVQDMRTEWELVQASRGPKDTEGAMPDDGEFSPEIHEFFKRSSPKHIGRRDESLMVDPINEKTAVPSDDSNSK
ncbi:related to inorganic phosphate permease [Fusarium fujikuroi IMI 58289]|uniref:Related to inorganic phosphate permease n=1 Tax=Gibberella fujikuroi (strain CBS 195.34 / IMI 58289 / NRRL A-6831) TaxID=1279085 RepID=S0DN57_GIBF5|nr:related to inorganic phosphate permease [Fusarium fujikuroi IMI 58289]KLP00280.1 inorganic phosphate permease [Fusarium fujikuroi]CCT61988.1 related to inorganic phosphate permease [Fusarium fujikuroi IMI 58289]SCN75800.1 related to inorganic phosphate permease [Fusarium fujikuroi]SCO27749.1 related to inorganic phosphate permease [Fusarium fujikuroi]